MAPTKALTNRSRSKRLEHQEPGTWAPPRERLAPGVVRLWHSMIAQAVDDLQLLPSKDIRNIYHMRSAYNWMLELHPRSVFTPDMVGWISLQSVCDGLAAATGSTLTPDTLRKSAEPMLQRAKQILDKARKPDVRMVPIHNAQR